MRQEIIVHVKSFIMEVEIPDHEYDDSSEIDIVNQIREEMKNKKDFCFDDFELLDDRFG
jgi:hypothetical protein